MQLLPSRLRRPSILSEWLRPCRSVYSVLVFFFACAGPRHDVVCCSNKFLAAITERHPIAHFAESRAHRQRCRKKLYWKICEVWQSQYSAGNERQKTNCSAPTALNAKNCTKKNETVAGWLHAGSYSRFIHRFCDPIQSHPSDNYNQFYKIIMNESTILTAQTDVN